MRWPFVSRAKYEADVFAARREALAGMARPIADEANRLLEAFRVEANRLIALAESQAGAVAVIQRNSLAESASDAPPADAKGAPGPDLIAQAIRNVAGGDRPLARHLRAVADDRLAADVPVREIVREIQQGQEVPL